MALPEAAVALKYPEAYDLEGEEADSCSKVSPPLCAAEVSSCCLSCIGIVLIICGILLLTVNPPGQADLCNIQTLGLTNSTKSQQDLVLNGCNALYTTVFAACGILAAAFFFIGLLPLCSACALCRAACCHDEDTSPKFFGCAACLGICGLIVVWVPSMFIPALAIACNTAMAPIHAYWIALTAGNYGMKLANFTSGSGAAGEQIRDVTYVTTTLYQGYSAAYRFELAVTVGGVCLGLLFWLYAIEICTNIARVTCWKPRYAELDSGSQLCHVRRAWGEKMRKDYPSDDERY